MVNKGRKAKRMPHTLFILTVLLSLFTSNSAVTIINSFNNNSAGDGSFNNNANQFPGWFPSRRDERPPKTEYPGFSPHLYSKKSSSKLCCRGYLMYVEEKITSTYFIDGQGRRYILSSSSSMTPYGSGGGYSPYGGRGGGYSPYGGRGGGYSPYGGSGSGYSPYGGSGGGYSPYSSSSGMTSHGIGGYLLYNGGGTPYGIGGYLLYNKGDSSFSPYGSSGQYSPFDGDELPYLRRQYGGGRGGRRRGGRRRKNRRRGGGRRRGDYRDYEDNGGRFGGQDRDGISNGEGYLAFLNLNLGGKTYTLGFGSS